MSHTRLPLRLRRRRRFVVLSARGHLHSVRHSYDRPFVFRNATLRRTRTNGRLAYAQSRAHIPHYGIPNNHARRPTSVRRRWAATRRDATHSTRSHSGVMVRCRETVNQRRRAYCVRPALTAGNINLFAPIMSCARFGAEFDEAPMAVGNAHTNTPEHTRTFKGAYSVPESDMKYSPYARRAIGQM